MKNIRERLQTISNTIDIIKETKSHEEMVEEYSKISSELGDYISNLKSEIKELTSLSKSLESKMGQVDNEIVNIILDNGKNNKIEHNGIIYAIKQNPPKVEIDDEDVIIDEFKNGTIKIPMNQLNEILELFSTKPSYKVEVDKTRIKDAINNGIEVIGARLVRAFSRKK